MKRRLSQTGILAALGAALLFGAGTPLAKTLLETVNPWLLAGLLYLGSGIGLTAYRVLSRAAAVRLSRIQACCFAGAILAGGIAGPVLLMFGLTGMPASDASLLLNAESVFTALLAWFVFKENVDFRIALGMGSIVAGALVLSWPGETKLEGIAPTLAVLGACLAWAIDNNLTRKVSFADSTWIASLKGLVAGSVNLVLALSLGASMPKAASLAGGLIVGLFAYGVSLSLFVVGLRHLGTARTGAYFAIAPFFGAVLAVLMGEPFTLPLTLAGALMALGAWLHVTERHVHEHYHEATEHDHEHLHDEHHQHRHDYPVPPGLAHSHLHRHDPQTHSHPHYPDIHHRHEH
ncbi:MAG: DMT family transporter [Thiobacillaceae bacterium]